MELSLSPESGAQANDQDDDEEGVVRDLLKRIDERGPEQELEAEVEHLHENIEMLEKLARSSSTATRDKCQEVAVKLRHRANSILNKAIDEDVAKSKEREKIVEPEVYFIGVMQYSSNDPEGRTEYVGAILNDLRLGLGSMRWADGTLYQGEWLHDKTNGLACEWYTDGSVYRGQFFEDHREGVGSWTNSNSTKYVGDWKNGEKHGTGVVVKPSPEGSKCALCTFDKGSPTSRVLVSEKDPQCAAILARAEGIIKDAIQMSDAAAKMTEEVLKRGARTPRMMAKPRGSAENGKQGSRPASSDQVAKTGSRPATAERKKGETYKAEEIVVKRDRQRLRLRGRGAGRLGTRGAVTKDAQTALQSAAAGQPAGAGEQAKEEEHVGAQAPSSPPQEEKATWEAEVPAQEQVEMNEEAGEQDEAMGKVVGEEAEEGEREEGVQDG
eukprot:CAMPEP_0181325894 /NCGR_PEP_ID=MMETSP1101-20121128/21187_1 /TAXON_ID=46948 /ORGANISM="Rhodomonas abbreviata, Strain Caron Lab Isolate" /LENGTH=439 /DNA_ID=CAMNT_0023434269 /DNA_START=102 /DNA_END=1417 /DNA_ORIENTATION=+